MKDPRDQIAELQRQARGLPYSPTKVALLEEAVQLADSVQDVDLAYRQRKDLMSAAAFSGRSDIMLVAFSWCLAKHDRAPERFDRHGLLWIYKWVIGHAYKFPEISRQRLEMLLDDMERRYREYGSTLHSVSLLRRNVMQQFDERQLAQAAHAEFRKRRRDDLSDCAACVASRNCSYYRFQRQWSRSLQAAKEVLQGRLMCTQQPHVTLSNVLIPLLHLGRIEDAKAHQAKGYRLVSRGNHFVGQHAEHLEFLALIGDFARAKRVLERHLPGALETIEIDDRFLFFQAACLWADRLISRGTSKLKIRLPQSLPAPDADGKSDVSALRAWFAAQALEIARRFDARNGTTGFQQQIDELPELLRLALD